MGSISVVRITFCGNCSFPFAILVSFCVPAMTTKFNSFKERLCTNFRMKIQILSTKFLLKCKQQDSVKFIQGSSDFKEVTFRETGDSFAMSMKML